LADVQEVFNAGSAKPWGLDKEAGVQAVMDFIENDHAINSNVAISAPQKLWHTSPGIAG
jgi:hypothetical protein